MKDAQNALTSRGVHLMPAAVTTRCLGLQEMLWARFRTHWNQLSTDSYAAERGVRRLRRYGQFCLSRATEQTRLLPQASFVQPENSNPLYIGVERTFAPLTDSFMADPVFGAVLRLLRRVATSKR